MRMSLRLQAAFGLRRRGGDQVHARLPVFSELESGGSEDSESPATELAEQERRRDGETESTLESDHRRMTAASTETAIG